MAEQYYLQDSRQYVGNDLLWWQDGSGYTCDISKAEVFTKEEAFKQNRSRHTDIPWSKSYVDERIQSVVDAQKVSISEALASTGDELYEPPKPKYQPYRCGACGRFTDEKGFYLGCDHCGESSRP